MKILLLDLDYYIEQFLKFNEDLLKAHTIKTLSLNASEEEIKNIMPDAEVIICNTEINIPVRYLDYFPNLKMIHSTGIGYNNLPLHECKKRGIYVCNCKAMNAISVAEHTIMMMLVLTRDGIRMHQGVKNNLFDSLYEEKYNGNTLNLHEMKVGLIGLGDVGLQVTKRLNAFGSQVYYYDKVRRDVDLEKAFNITYLPLSKLISSMDLISLHLPVSDGSYHMVNKEFISHMKSTAYIVNCARGELIDNEAMHDALEQGLIAGGAFDTIAPQPVTNDNPLISLSPDHKAAVFYTPHIAGCGRESLAIGIKQVWDNINRLNQGLIPHSVKLD